MFNLFNRKKIVELKAPVKGDAVAITSVPDEVFAGKLVGDGIALNPREGILYAPVSGEIILLFPTNHAVGIKTKEGLEILLHIGIDTVNMKGAGFQNLVELNQKVQVGDALMQFDCELIQNQAKSLLTPMVITNMDLVETLSCRYGPVEPGIFVVKARLK
jgi:PTS system glucose-specific IIA component